METKAETTMLEMLDRWVEITIDQLHQALDHYEIGKLDGRLWHSIVGHVLKTGEEPRGVVIKFMQYGRFVDMGVGRGVPIGKRGTAAFGKYRDYNGTSKLQVYNRQAKPWYSKTKSREIFKLRELLAANLVDKVISETEMAFGGEHENAMLFKNKKKK